MKLSTLVLLAALLLGVFSATAQARRRRPLGLTPSSQLGLLFERYWERTNQLYPLQATGQGDHRYDNLLPNDQTQVFRDTLRQFYQRSLGQLRRFDRTTLSTEERISYDIFRYRLQTDLAGLQLTNWMMPISQLGGSPLAMGGVPLALAQLGPGTGPQPFRTVADYEQWLARVHGFPAWADSAISNFRRGIRAGVVLPRSIVVKMVPQLRALTFTEASKSSFYGPVTRFPSRFSAAERQRLTLAFQRALPTDVGAPYQRLADFLEKEYLPKARLTSGFGALPGAPARYNYSVRYWTTTDRTPADIYETGVAEVKRIRAEMERVKRQIGFKGTLAHYFAYVNTDPRFQPYKTEAEVLAGCRAIQARLAPQLPKYFSRVPRTGFEVRAVEAYREALAPAQYARGAPDASWPGVFYVPILNPTTYNTVANPAMEALFLHEAIPGHHYQVSLQQENTELPKFRRFGSYSAMGEGWALYCESLGTELGLYTDPHQRLGALGTEMLRAIRLVVDVGLHARRLTREQAIKYLMDNQAISEANATAEVERYMAIPGQALAYKIGQLKIQELRDRYRLQLGPKFDLRAFHDELLKDGMMPLEVLERKMNAWALRQ
jgi:uncharacterized protein (DUF885 family)